MPLVFPVSLIPPHGPLPGLIPRAPVPPVLVPLTVAAPALHSCPDPDGSGAPHIPLERG